MRRIAPAAISSQRVSKDRISLLSNIPTSSESQMRRQKGVKRSRLATGGATVECPACRLVLKRPSRGRFPFRLDARLGVVVLRIRTAAVYLYISTPGACEGPLGAPYRLSIPPKRRA